MVKRKKPYDWTNGARLALDVVSVPAKAARPAKRKVPSEALEAARLVDWLRVKGLHYSHIPGEAVSRVQRIKNARAGYVPGLPDFLILLPKLTLWIELKRVKGGRVSPAQLGWVAVLNSQPAQLAMVCEGFDEARKLVEKHL